MCVLKEKCLANASRSHKRVLFPQRFSLFHETLSVISTGVGMSSNISMISALFTPVKRRCA